MLSESELGCADWSCVSAKISLDRLKELQKGLDPTFTGACNSWAAAFGNSIDTSGMFSNGNSCDSSYGVSGMSCGETASDRPKASIPMSSRASKDILMAGGKHSRTPATVGDCPCAVALETLLRLPHGNLPYSSLELSSAL
jgi:hypothetical protein